MDESLLTVRNFSVVYPTDVGEVRAVREVGFDARSGERIGIVGESGSGKSSLALGLMRLLPPGARAEGEVRIDGVDVLTASPAQLRAMRGEKAGMIFQDPMRSFDPLRTIGYHLFRGMRAHQSVRRATADEKAKAVLRTVGMPSPEVQLRRRPHELSGGMRQRSLIALGVENEPQLLIADEPTTALDVTIQAQIGRLLSSIGAPGVWEHMALLLVSHNLGLVREICTRIIVMYSGEIVEDAPVDAFFRGPRHPYGAALLAAMPKLSGARGSAVAIPGQPADATMRAPGCAFAPRCSVSLPKCEIEIPALTEIDEHRRAACFVGAHEPLVRSEPRPGSTPTEGSAAGPQTGATLAVLRDVTKMFRGPLRGPLLGRRAPFAALDGIDLDLFQGETLALVGESGSGKSTLARLVLGLLGPDRGSVVVDGADPARLQPSQRARQSVQAVFQDPHGSLDPRMSVRRTIEQPLINLGTPREARRRRVQEVLTEVQLPSAFGGRYPHELSGGQAQRVAVARALAVRPKLIVLDEPTASLDVSIQTHVVSLLERLQEEHGLTYLFVSHDLAAVREIATRVAVMYLGRLVEVSPVDRFFRNPLHPYSRALLAAVPQVDKQADDGPWAVRGEPPSAFDAPSGCPFHPRCPIAADLCSESRPPLVEHVTGPLAACHFPVMDSVPDTLEVQHG